MKSKLKVFVSTKGKRFTVFADKAQDVKLHRSKSYYSNSNATRAAKSYCKKEGYWKVEFI